VAPQRRGAVVAVVAVRELLRVELHGHPDLRRLGGVHREVGRKREAPRHDADDPPRLPVQLDDLSEDVRVSAEAVLPDGVGEDGDGRSAGDVLVLGEAAPEDGPAAQRLERVGGDARDADPDGLSPAGEIRGVGLPRRDPLEARDLAPVVHDLAVGEPRLVEVLPAAPDHDPPVGLRVRERRQQDRADHREDRGRRPHPER
jgi:hypothetical protein